MSVIKWFHHLFNPHCPECAHDLACKNCEILQGILEQERYEKKQLLEKLLHKDDLPVATNNERILEIPKPRNIPWSVRQQMLETEDRLANKARKEIADLEKELDIPTGTDNAS